MPERLTARVCSEVLVEVEVEVEVVVGMDGGLLRILSFLTLAVLGLLEEEELFVEGRWWEVAAVTVEVVEVMVEEVLLLLFGR